MSNIEIVTTLDGFEALAPTWRRIYSENRRNRVFQSYDWNMAAWKHFHQVHMPDEKLYIVYAKQEGRLACEVILPFCIDRCGCLRFIGHEMTDVLSEVSPVHTDNWHEFYLQIIRYLQKQDVVKSVLFTNLEDSSEVLEYFGAYWKGVEISYCDSISYFSSSKSEDLSVAIPHLVSEYRSGVKRLAKKFPEYDFAILSLKSGDEYPLKKLDELRMWMIQNGLRVEAASPKAYLDVMKCVYDAGLCEVSCLIDKNTGSFVYAAFRLLGESNIVFWVIFYKDGAMTTCGDARYILAKTTQGAFTFDFGTGLYVYKLGTYLPRVRNLYKLSQKSHGAGGFLNDLYWLCRRYLKDFLVSISLIK